MCAVTPPLKTFLLLLITINACTSSPNIPPIQTPIITQTIAAPTQKRVIITLAPSETPEPTSAGFPDPEGDVQTCSEHLPVKDDLADIVSVYTHLNSQEALVRVQLAADLEGYAGVESYSVTVLFFSIDIVRGYRWAVRAGEVLKGEIDPLTLVFVDPNQARARGVAVDIHRRPSQEGQGLILEFSVSSSAFPYGVREVQVGVVHRAEAGNDFHCDTAGPYRPGG